MKSCIPTKSLASVLVILASFFAQGNLRAEDWILIGISGQESDDNTDAAGHFVYQDHTIYQINHYNAAVHRLVQVPWVPDSQAIGYCPTNSLVYHTAGASSYRNDFSPGHDQGGPDVLGVGYQDNQYMGTVNLTTQAFAGVFNCNPCPNPDGTLPCFGLSAPVPSWVLPAYRRNSTQTDPTNQVTGPNEYHAARGLAWSTNRNLFYLADELGIFKLTTSGDSIFLARPSFSFGGDSNANAIAFVTVTNTTKLWVGNRAAGYIMEIDPETGDNLGELALTHPNGGGNPELDFGGLLALAQHPLTGVIYGIRKTDDNTNAPPLEPYAGAFYRELVTINPLTGATTLVGRLGMHISSLAFVPSVPWKPASGAYRLIGISGQQVDNTLDGTGQFVFQDHTVFEINHENGASHKLVQVPWVPDSQAIGYCPTNGLVYHTGGASSYRNDFTPWHDQGGPDVPGVNFQDNQYMGTVNLATEAFAGVFNCNPCPNPDATLPCFGLPAPVPSWVLPAYRRNSSQTDPTNQVTGPNEYQGARGLAWSTNKHLFYLSDSAGIFKMTTAGDSTFLARPSFSVGGNIMAKAIAFVTVTNKTKLWVGNRNAGLIMEVEPETGAKLGELALTHPVGGGEPLGDFAGLLGLAQHPVTGIIYGLRQTSNPGVPGVTDAFFRELVTINPLTGETARVGALDVHFTSLVFVPMPSPLQIKSITRSGNDVQLTWSDGKQPYQVQQRSSLSSGSWSNVGGTTTQTSATITNGVTGNTGFFRVFGQ